MKLLACLVCVLMVWGGRVYGQIGGRVLAGPGVPLIIQGVDADALSKESASVAARAGVKGVEPRHIKAATIRINVSPRASSDPAWRWQSGSGSVSWESLKHGEVAGVNGVQVVWAEAVTEEWVQATGGTVVVGGKECTIVWMPGTELASGRDVLQRAAERVIEQIDKDEQRQAGDSLKPAMNTPSDQWRSAALLRALGRKAENEFEAGPVSVLAQQEEAAIFGVLGRIARFDRSLADRVADCLVTMVRLPSGVGGQEAGMWAPAWSPVRWGGVVSESLLEAVLGAGGADKQIVTRLQGYLASQNGAGGVVSWVHDDAGLKHTGGSVATICAVNLEHQKRSMTVRTAGADAVGDGAAVLTPLKSDSLFVKGWESLSLPIVERQRLAGSGVPVIVSVGVEASTTSGVRGRDYPLTTFAVAVPVVPPCASIGPFANDWTMNGWRNGQVTMSAGMTAGTITPAAIGEGWQVYIECQRLTVASEHAQPEKLRLWIGPSGNATAMVEASSDGTVTTKKGTKVNGVKVAATSSGWCATIPIAAELGAVEKSGVLRLGLERVDSLGNRSAWPRPMFPWQSEPGRVALDLSAWDRGLSNEP